MSSAVDKAKLDIFVQKIERNPNLRKPFLWYNDMSYAYTLKISKAYLIINKVEHDAFIKEIAI